MKGIRGHTTPLRAKKKRATVASRVMGVIADLIATHKPTHRPPHHQAGARPHRLHVGVQRRAEKKQRKFSFTLPSWFSAAKMPDWRPLRSLRSLRSLRPFQKIPPPFSLPNRVPLSIKMPTFLSREASSIPEQSAESIKKRLKFMVGMFILAFIILAVRAFDLTVLQHNTLKRRVQKQYLRHVTIPAYRGRILDRHRRTLAISLPVKALSVDINRMRMPGQVPSNRRLAERLAPLIGLPLHALRKRLQTARPGSFPVLKRRLPPVIIRKIQRLENPALFLIPETQRFYPMGEITSHILGFSNFEGEGVEGVERSLEEALKGKPGKSILARDRLGRPLPTTEVVSEANPGNDMVLTIDSNIQYIAYRTLLKGVKRARARGGMVVVMNPNNGEIYAMVNRPGFNPNNLGKSKGEGRRNRAIADAYEPGSTFKLVTLSAALDLGLVTPNTLFDVEGGKFRVANRTIRDFHRGFHWLSVSQILVTSSNVGAAKVGMMMGNEAMDEYMFRFGFGRRTGIGFHNESPGSIPDITFYRVVGLANRSYGYGITATALQITMASAAVANGGKLYKPRLVLGKLVDGQWFPSKPSPPQQVIKPEISATMRSILAMVVGPKGTAPKAHIDGYSVAGKTGTARKAVGKQGYVRGLYFSSFVGFVPADKPKLLIYVGIDEPKGFFYGGLVAAPIFREIGQEILPLLSIFPEKHTDPDLPGVAAPSPDIKRNKKSTRKVDKKVPDKAKERVRSKENPSENPEENLVENLEEPQKDTSLNDLLQLSLMEALEQLSKKNMIPRVEGHGQVSRVEKGKDGEVRLFLE